MKRLLKYSMCIRFTPLSASALFASNSPAAFENVPGWHFVQEEAPESRVSSQHLYSQ
jgi:hypothetical protein